MVSMRVTPGLIQQQVLTDLQGQETRLLQLQEQLASGQRVNQPSDDPVAAGQALNAMTVIQQNNQYTSNINSVGPQLGETSTVLGNVMNTIQRANELALQGATGTNSQDQLDALATEVNQLLEGVVVSANHQTNGKYIFSGTRTQTPAYSVTRDANGDITAVTYQGDNAHYQVATGAGASSTVNMTGPEAFQSTQDVFQLLINLRDNLRNGDQSAIQNSRIAEIAKAQSQISSAQAQVGAVQNRLSKVSSDTATFTTQAQQLLSDSVDADFAQTIVNLNAQQNAFQAALSAAAQIIQPSLLNFLK